MRFIKMHGLGNDFVFVDEFEELFVGDAGEVARRISDRHRGIGSDGLILVGPSERADFRMRIFNADGSDGGMCGNGLRCAAKYLFEEGRLAGEAGLAETGDGFVRVEILADGRIARRIRVFHGPPVLDPPRIPTTLEGTPVADRELVLDDGESGGPDRVRVTCVSVGNPHCIVMVARVQDVPLADLGPRIETHPVFPAKTNVHFVQIVAPGRLRMRSWERGCGETLACGTGAAASVVAVGLAGVGRGPYAMELPGGELEAEWLADGRVAVTGPAEEVFRGTW